MVRTPISLLATCRECKEQYLIIPTMHFNHTASLGCTTYIDTDISRICNLLNTRTKVPDCCYVPNAEGPIHYTGIYHSTGRGGKGEEGEDNQPMLFRLEKI